MLLSFQKPVMAHQSPLSMSAFSASYLPVKQRILGKKSMHHMATKYGTKRFPSKRDIHVYFHKKRKHKGRMIPPWKMSKGKLMKKLHMMKLSQHPRSKSFGKPNHFDPGFSAGGHNAFERGNIPGIGINQPFEQFPNTPGEHPIFSKIDGLLRESQMSDVTSNNPEFNNMDMRSNRPGGHRDIPYSVETLGLGQRQNVGFRSPTNSQRQFELVPLSIQGNDLIVGNANDIVLSNNRNPEMTKAQLPNGLPTQISGVDFASQLKSGPGRIDSIPVHGLAKQSTVDVMPVTMGPLDSGLTGTGLDPTINSISGIGGLQVSGLTTIDNVPISGVGSSMFFGNNNGVNLGQTSGGISGGLGASGSLSVGSRLPLGPVLDSVVDPALTDPSATQLTIESPIGGAGSGERTQSGGGTWFRYTGYMNNIEPFGPGPYGKCRLPSQVICGARRGWEHVTGMNGWCKSNCVVYMYSSYCDDDRCECKCK